MRSLDDPLVHHPAVLDQWVRRNADLQLHVADRITALAAEDTEPTCPVHELTAELRRQLLGR
jgi:hypothetical protein